MPWSLRRAAGALPAWVRGLPTVNASLNGLCAVLLIAGWILIRTSTASPIDQASALPAGNCQSDPALSQPGRSGAIVVCMLLAVATSAVFLACYLVYHFQAGSIPSARRCCEAHYFTILLSHTVLATFGVVPLVVVTLVRGLRGDFARHARSLK